MTSNRLTYDNCAYAQVLKESTSQLDYNIFVKKYENEKQCPGGDFTNVLPINNRVDVENELHGIVRNSSKCSSLKYDPTVEFKAPGFSPPTMCASIYYITPNNLVKPTTNMLNNINLNNMCN